MNNKIKKYQVLTYGMGSLGKDLAGGLISTFLLVFFTDVFGISAGVAGMILMLTRVWDAVNDPMMGTIVDRTNTKLGRYRPYLLIVPVFMCIFYWLTFTTPSFDSMTGKIVWATVTYTLAGMAFTAYDVPLWGMIPAISNDPNERNKLITSQRTFTFIAYLLVGTFTYPLVAKLGGGVELANTRLGYSRLALIFGIIGIIFAWITFATNKETTNISKEKTSIKEMFGILKANKHVQLLLVASFCTYLTTYIISSVNVYYLTYYLGKPNLISVLMFVSMGATVVGMFFAVGFAKHFGRMKATVASIIIGVVASLLMLLLGKNLIILMILLVVYGIVISIPTVTLTSMIADAGDYTEWKTNVRIDGVIFSLNSSVTKLGMAIASGFAGLFLSCIGYVPQAETQSAATLMGINIMRFAIPVIPLLICIVLLKKYKLDDATMDTCRAELLRRRETEL
ncbi:MFS transporter [Robinsoniella peoriensis]|uniref:Thiomethylgalactoside permease II n=1 Tax=Robinsoniella peoriensis TaxID=180332 RepID=A0A4U8Q0L4_9FIRM|nr:glycoside-pentoside-hexuronide (GPH):cation symporter [Robinsoniella peoriensis]TLC98170.1 Thiomethylgalactoside permease II [Robinsoniella peoriensis]